MPRIVGFLIFLTIALTVYGGMHLFVYKRIVSGLDPSEGLRLALKIVFIVGALSFILGEALSRFTWVFPLLFYGSVWMGVMSIAVSLFLLEWAAALLGLEPGRLRIGVAVAAVLMISGWSLFNGLRAPVVRRHTVHLAGLPAGMAGFSIVQLSDLHLGNLTSLGRLERIVSEVNRLDPDLVAITGDLLDRDVCQSADFCRVMKRLRARHGVVAVTGNHEFYAGVEVFSAVARRNHWTVLRNRHLLVDGRLVVAGLDDDAGRQMGEPGPDLQAALAGAPAGLPRILLYHRPARFAEARALGVGLQLAGHTHAGQIPPMDLLVSLIYRYPAGIYSGDGFTIHTSCGTSTWGPPMRFLSRSEITRLELQPGG